jgi:hypothetical protein
VIRRRALRLFLALVSTTPAVTIAQSAAIAPGTVVRLTAPAVSKKRLVGTVMSPVGDTVSVAVLLKPPDGVWIASVRRYSIPASQVTRLEVSRRVSGSVGARRGALIGLSTGAFLGSILGFTTPDALCFLCGKGTAPTTRERLGAALGYGAFFGLLSAGFGVATGAIMESEDWRRVQLSPTPRS